MEDLKIINNKELSRFEIQLEEEIATLEYRFYKNNLALMHTQVPPGMKGKGIGSKLVLSAIDFAIKEHKKLMLYCPFAAKFVKEHEEFHKYVDAHFHPSLKH